MARFGGELATRAETDRVVLTGSALGEAAPALIGLLGEVALMPRFADAEVLRKRADLGRTLALRRSQPGQLAREKFRAAVYADHPYGRLMPTAQQLEALTPAQVRAFWEKNAGGARAHLYVVGIFDPGPTEAAIRAAFSGWEKGTPPTVNPPKPMRGRRVYLIDRPGAPPIDDRPRHARGRPVHARFPLAGGEQHAPRRRVRVAHYPEHPRGQGLYLFALFNPLRPAT